MDPNRRGGSLIVPAAAAVVLLGAISVWVFILRDAEGRSRFQRWFGPEPPAVVGRLVPAPPPSAPHAVMVVLCAGGDVRAHVHDRESHSAAAKPADRTGVRVEKIEVGSLGPGAEPAVYGSAAARVRELLETAPSGSGVVLDADPEVPFVHLTGVVDALKRLGLDDVTIQRR